MGTQLPPQKRGGAPSPIFDPFLFRHQNASWYGGRPHPRGLCVRWGLSPSPQKGAEPPTAHVCCGQTAAWIKMSIGTEVGLSPGDFVLDRDPAPPPQKGGGGPSPIFGPCPLWPNGCMDQDANWYRGRPQPRRLCARWGPSSTSPKGAEPLPNFRPMSIVAKRLHGSRCQLGRR